MRRRLCWNPSTRTSWSPRRRTSCRSSTSPATPTFSAVRAAPTTMKRSSRRRPAIPTSGSGRAPRSPIMCSRRRPQAMPIDFDPEDGDTHQEIRTGVRRLCAQFPGEYWRRLDREAAYPANFVKAVTAAGYMAALIPEEYGGSGLPLSAAAAILEEIQRAGCNAGACHAQMYIMGTLLRHGSAEQKRKYLPEIAAGRLRLQAFGVTEPTTGTDTTKLKTRAEKKGNDRYIVRGQKVWTSRALHSDLMLLLARTTPVEQVKRRI